MYIHEKQIKLENNLFTLLFWLVGRWDKLDCRCPQLEIVHSHFDCYFISNVFTQYFPEKS